MTAASPSLDTIRATFATMRRKSRARHRDIAESLAISEGELIAAHAGLACADSAGRLQATVLRSEWPEIIRALEPLGEVMALTRNASCVHEKVGVYRKASHQGQMGLVLGGAIDLRVFYRHWAHGFAVTEQTDKGTQRSLQFFDASGMAVHKVFLRPQSDLAAYDLLVERFTVTEQTSGIHTVTTEAKAAERSDDDIDIDGFRAAWAGLKDTHEFFGVLKKFGVSRTQAVRLADPALAQQIDVDNCQRLLERAAETGVGIMVFVGNHGMIQIHSGAIQKFAAMGPWLNVLDPGFNLHLRGDHIVSAWVVRKPTVDGIVTSIEIFDIHGEIIALFFGERKPGKPELNGWRELVASLLPEAQPCVA